MTNIATLITKKLLGIATKSDRTTLSDWEKRSNSNQSFSNNMQAYWEHPTEETPSPNIKMANERLFSRINSHGNKAVIQRRFFTLFSKVAAIALLLLSTATVSVYLASQSGLFREHDSLEVMTETGQQSKIKLPDGSLVWLNAETTLSYSTEKNNRKVNLTGEAYFEVFHAPEKPFIVETEYSTIKVLGTKFNVAHYPNSTLTETSLVSGKISMSVSGNKKEIELLPGEKATYDAEKHILQKSTPDVERQTLWREGLLVFEDESFTKLIEKLERYYAVRFVYDKDEFEDFHYTGVIDNLTIKKLLDYINLTNPITYHIDNKTIHLKKKRTI